MDFNQIQSNPKKIRQETGRWNFHQPELRGPKSKLFKIVNDLWIPKGLQQAKDWGFCTFFCTLIRRGEGGWWERKMSQREKPRASAPIPVDGSQCLDQDCCLAPECENGAVCVLNNFRIVDGLCRPTFPSLDIRVHCGYPMLVSSLCIECVGGR